MEEEGKLINEFNENEFNIKFNKKKKNNQNLHNFSNTNYNCSHYIRN